MANNNDEANTLSILQVRIDKAKWRARFGSASRPERGNVFDGWTLSPMKKGFVYTIIWNPKPATPFTVWARERDLHRRGLHRVGYSYRAYLGLMGEKPHVGHFVPGDILLPKKEGYFTVVSIGNGWLLVEREEVDKGPDDLTAIHHLEDDAILAGVDDLAQYELYDDREKDPLAEDDDSMYMELFDLGFVL